MAEQIRLSFEVEPDLMRRAIVFASTQLQNGASAGQRLGKVGVFVGVGLFLIVLDVLLRPAGIGLLNAGFLAGLVFAIACLALFQRQAMRRIAGHVVQSANRRGPIQLTIGAGGLSEQSGIGRIDVVWEAVDQIAAIPGGSVVRFGGMCFAIPDHAVPDDLTPSQLRDQLDAWRTASDTFG